MGALGRMWGKWSGVDKLACAFVVFLCLAAFTTWPLVRRLYPDAAVIGSWTHGDASDAKRLDPWGRLFVIRWEAGPGGGEQTWRVVYSRGPNGKDEGGGGDDRVLFDPIRGRGPSGRVHAGSILLSQSQGFLLTLAIFVLGTYVAARRGRATGTFRRELIRAAMHSVPLGILASTMAFMASYSVIGETARGALESRMYLSAGPALIGSVFALTFLTLLAVRLLHAKEGTATPKNKPPQETLEAAAERWLREDGLALGSEPPEGRGSTPPPASSEAR
jgi:hypothetical protein